MQRRAFLKAGAAGVLVGLAGRSWAADMPSAGDLAGDVAILRQALTLHPGLYRYSSQTAIERSLARFATAWGAAPGIEGRYLALSTLTASFRCGHSYGNFYNQSKAVQAALFDRPTRLPFRFIWLGDQMVVTSMGPEGLVPGTAIERINGVEPIALRRRLMPYIRADGHNDAKRVSLLEVRGDDEFETFDVFQGLLAPPDGAEHHVEAILPGGDRRVLSLPAIDLKARQAAMTVADAKEGQPLWQWQMRPDGVAVLTMPGWAIWDSKWNWQGWLDDRLDTLSGARGLVVDLRDNEGGADCGNGILARLLDRTYVPSRWEQRVRFRRTPVSIDRYLDTWDDSFRTLGEKAAVLPGGFYQRPAADDTLAIEPSGKKLGVPIAVLTSPVNSSATFQFADTVRTLGVGKLVGEATGGNRRGINGGCFFFVRLPASGLEFDLPLVGYFPAIPQPDAGLLPDIAVRRTAADIAQGRDPALDRAAAMLRGG